MPPSSAAPTAGNLTVQRLRGLPVRRGECWELGLVDLPGQVQERRDREPWTATAVACVSRDGVASVAGGERAERLSSSVALDAVAALALGNEDMVTPACGYLPSVLRVSALSPGLHEHLASAMRDLGVAVEVTDELPHVRRFTETMRRHCQEREQAGMDAPALARVRGMTVERIRAFADAGCAFYEAAPWTLLEGDVAWEITPRPRTPALRSCVVMGGGGQEFGLAFLRSPLDLYGIHLRALVGVADARPHGTNWSVLFAKLHLAPAEDAVLWMEERLPIAPEDRLPVPVGVTEMGHVLRPAPDQLRLMEALLRLFASMTRDEAAGELISRSVVTFEGPLALELGVGAAPGRDRDESHRGPGLIPRQRELG